MTPPPLYWRVWIVATASLRVRRVLSSLTVYVPVSLVFPALSVAKKLSVVTPSPLITTLVVEPFTVVDAIGWPPVAE